MKRFTAFILLLVTLALCAGVAGAGFSVPSPVDGSDADGGRLDLKSEFNYDAQAEKQQIKVTVSTDSGYSACETRFSYSKELVVYANKFIVNPAIEAVVDVTVQAQNGILYMTCYNAPGNVPGDIVTIYFDILPNATGTATFAFTEGYVGKRTGLDIPPAILGESAANELVDGIPVAATNIVSADAEDGEVSFTFDAAPSAQWRVICASYNADGKMLRCKAALSTGEVTQSMTLGAGAGETVRIIVLSGLKPVMASKSFTVQGQ